MSTPCKNTSLSGNIVESGNMNSSEINSFIERMKEDWMDHNNEKFNSLPIIPNILRTDFDVILTSVKHHGLALTMASNELKGNIEKGNIEIVTAAM